jgi:purine-binding chemotaxis protein CheW
MSAEAMAARAWCTFRLDGRHYGIDVRRVQEVLGAADVSPVPLAPPGVRGLINLRGRIVTAIDLRVCFGSAGATPPGGSHIVIADDSTPVSLIVDAVDDVERGAGRAVQPAPDTLDPRAKRMILGALPLPGRLLLILDLDRALAAAFAA